MCSWLCCRNVQSLCSAFQFDQLCFFKFVHYMLSYLMASFSFFPQETCTQALFALSDMCQNSGEPAMPSAEGMLKEGH